MIDRPGAPTAQNGGSDADPQPLSARQLPEERSLIRRSGRPRPFSFGGTNG